jgi:hypothetical protein
LLSSISTFCRTPPPYFFSFVLLILFSGH